MKEFAERLIDSIGKRKEIILSHDVIDAEDEAMVFAYNETINIIKFFAEKYKFAVYAHLSLTSGHKGAIMLLPYERGKENYGKS